MHPAIGASERNGLRRDPYEVVQIIKERFREHVQSQAAGRHYCDEAGVSAPTCRTIAPVRTIFPSRISNPPLGMASPS